MKRARHAAAAALLLLPAAVARADTLPGEAKAQTCFACHGPNGNSGTPEVPSLAGQQAGFIVKQLHLFRDGGRQDAQMAPMAVNLTDTDIAELAAFFAQVAPEPPEQQADTAVAKAAHPLLERQHCTTCHGENFAGNQEVPRLAGQQKAYLAWQLRLFRDGKRNDASMRDATKPLSNQDINTLASYLSRLAQR